MGVIKIDIDGIALSIGLDNYLRQLDCLLTSDGCQMNFHCNYSLIKQITLSAEEFSFYLDNSLRILQKINFETHDIERLFRANIGKIRESNKLGDPCSEHVMDCFYEINAIEQLLNYLHPEQSLTWLFENNEHIKCSPIAVLPCCGLAAFSVVRILLEAEFKKKQLLLLAEDTSC